MSEPGLRAAERSQKPGESSSTNRCAAEPSRQSRCASRMRTRTKVNSRSPALRWFCADSVVLKHTGRAEDRDGGGGILTEGFVKSRILSDYLGFPGLCLSTVYKTPPPHHRSQTRSSSSLYRQKRLKQPFSKSCCQWQCHLRGSLNAPFTNGALVKVLRLP